MENMKRPQKDETDDDLLRQQENFFKESEAPSVKVVSVEKKQPKTPSPDSKEEIKSSGKSEIEIVSGDILFDIQERDVSFSDPFVFQPPAANPTKINDLLNKNVKLSKFAAKRKDQSIFVQMLNSAEHQNGDFVPKEKQPIESATSSTLVDGSGLESSEKDSEVKKIHEENLAKLSSMSKEEILHHQTQLENYLKPEILNFIKKKKRLEKKDASKSIQDDLKVNNKNIKKETEGKSEIPGDILRKEGKEDCDALILEKILESESIGYPSENQHGRDMPNTENVDIEIPEETKKIIEEGNKGLWRNMNKIEKEKLEWMTNLPQPKPIDLKTGYTARFDFEGKLLSREADIPTYKGLHHHGDEPEVPGYSLEELFLLARSSLQSQRITALNTIVHILENNWLGMMDKCFDAPLLPLLLNAGLVPLLRWALDDTSLTSVSATISAIHSLLISKADEVCSNKTFCWLNGHFIAQLEPQDLDEPNIVIEELTDADLIKLDVVKGFLRIDILPRFMYILKVMCPPPLVCKLVLEICARLAQHSPESAKQVSEFPGLLNLVFEKFAPLNWHFIDSSILTDTVDYSCPMHSALKLMRIIASSSKEKALELVEKYDILSIIKFYITVQPCDGRLTPQEVQLLIIETLKIWHSYLCYGYAFDITLDLFALFLKQLDFCQSLNLNYDTRKYIHDIDYATHLFKCFESVTVLAAEQTDNRFDLASHMNTIFKKSVICLKKWIWQVSQETTSSHGMTLLAACMNFVVTHCRKSHDGLICENWKPCASAKDTFEKFLIPAMKSSVFQNMLRDFRSFSLYLSSDISANKRDGKTIVSLGSVLYGEDVIPILKEGSPLPLLSAVLNYVLFYKHSFQDSGDECIQALLCSSIIDYLKEVSVKELNNNCWFLKFETYFIYQLVQLSPFMKPTNSLLSHETAISVLTAFSSPAECLVEDLLENTIFNYSSILKFCPLLISSDSNERNCLESLTAQLPVIAQCYISSFLDANVISKSRSLLLRHSNIESLFCLSTHCSFIPKDWCFMPIHHLYQKAKKRKEKDNLAPDEVLQVISCLQWVLMCHLLNLSIQKKMPASAEFYYLCQVFLLDEDIFRDDKIKALLIQCVSIILKQKTLKLSKIKWNGINNFDEMYLEMLMQFEAVSYGDEIFSNFLAIPLQQSCPSRWKKLLFTEHLPVISFLRLSLNNLLIPLHNFLEPIETDIGILYEYLKVLSSGYLNHRRCPLLYLMAVHHIHNFIFFKTDKYIKDQKKLLSAVLKLKKELQKILLLYLEVDTTSEFGFSLANELSSERWTYIRDYLNVPVNI